MKSEIKLINFTGESTNAFEAAGLKEPFQNAVNLKRLGLRLSCVHEHVNFTFFMHF